MQVRRTAPIGENDVVVNNRKFEIARCTHRHDNKLQPKNNENNDDGLHPKKHAVGSFRIVLHKSSDSIGASRLQDDSLYSAYI